MDQEENKKYTKQTHKVTQGIKKVKTQIEGLDDILHGGIPEGRTTLISGGPGTGKSVLGLEFLYRGALSEHPGIYITFEETKERITQNALTFGWDLIALEQAGKFFIIEARIDPDVIFSGEFNLDGLLALISGKAREMDADRIVLDALDILLRFFDDPKKKQNESFKLNKWLEHQNITTILTAKNIKDKTVPDFSYLDYMADCVLYMDQRVNEQVNTKRIQVIKYRGSGFSGNECPFLITEDGMHVDPITDIAMPKRSGNERISSGNPSFDDILGGGYQTGSCILISGPTGTGKTSFACNFSHSACKAGNKVLYINFEESQDSMFACMLSLGIDLSPAVTDSRLSVLSLMPESMGIEEHLFQIKTQIDHFKPHHLIMDAISACERIAGKMVAFDFIIRLINTCKQKGITVILINQLKSSGDFQEISGIGVSSIIDTIITLSYKDEKGGLGRRLLVRKSRGTRHSLKYHEFLLTDQGITIN
jgi:circadian clock protein KaiC